MKSEKIRRLPIRLIFCVSIFFLLLCEKDNSVDPGQTQQFSRGDLISSDVMSFYPTALIEGLLSSWEATLPFEIQLSVRTISITYQTVDALGVETVASGAILIPVGSNNLPLVSIQHGTETYRENVASVSPIRSPEGVLGVLLASMGYLACIPDYLGFGVSRSIHPYVHAESLATCVIDFLRACKQYCNEHSISLNGEMFLAGYSEGGYATLALQKTIESDHSTEFDITAVAPCAGPYNLLGMLMTILRTVDYSTPAYVGFLLTAYDDIYGWDRLDDFFVAPYDSRMPDLFDGSKTWIEVITQLPGSLAELLEPAFVTDVIDGKEPELIAAFQENTLLDWTPIAPVHFFHGDADQTVFYENALTAMDSLSVLGGADLQLTTIPGGTHATASLPSIIGFVEWFESIRNATLTLSK